MLHASDCSCLPHSSYPLPFQTYSPWKIMLSPWTSHTVLCTLHVLTHSILSITLWCIIYNLKIIAILQLRKLRHSNHVLDFMFLSSAQLLNHVQLFVILWTVAHLIPLSIEFFQARILEQVAISYSRGFSQPWDWAHVSCLSCISCVGRQIVYH